MLVVKKGTRIFPAKNWYVYSLSLARLSGDYLPVAITMASTRRVEKQMKPSGGIASGHLAINSGGDVVVCRQTVRRVADELQFTVAGRTMLVTAASELARNALIYGGGGTVTWEVRRDGPKVGVQLTFEDRGPGIPDPRLQ